MGVLRDQTGSYNTGVIGAAALSGSAALLLLLYRSRMLMLTQSLSD
jgi:hypothetical protein